MDIKNYFKNSEEIRSFYISAEKKLKTGQLQEAYQDFKRAGDALRCAYCLFLGGNIKDAERIINGIKDQIVKILCNFYRITRQCRYQTSLQADPLDHSVQGMPRPWRSNHRLHQYSHRIYSH